MLFLCSGHENRRFKVKGGFSDFCGSGTEGSLFLNGVCDYLIGSAQDLEITCSRQRVHFRTFTGLGGEGYFYTPDLKINVSNERVHFQTFTRLEGEGCLCAPDLNFNVSKLRVIFRLLRVWQGRAIFPKWRSCLFFEEALKTWKSRVRVNGLIFRVLRVWEGRDMFMPRILKSMFLSK